MLKAEIICTGSELLTNPKIETNSLYLAEGLMNIGIETRYKTVVGDTHDDLMDTINHAIGRADIIIVSGGLGPTVDDMTRDILSEITGRKLIFNSEIWEIISQRIKRFFPDREIPEMVKVQAYVPEKTEYFINQNGTAPGLAFKFQEKLLVALPGPPRELIPMWQHQASDWLKNQIDSSKKLLSKVIRIYGIPESLVNEGILDLFKNSLNPIIGVCAHPAMVDIRLLSWDDEKSTALEKIKDVVQYIEGKYQKDIYGYDQETLESVLVELLRDHELTLSLAESCTGGLISSRITDIPGSSDVFEGCVVTYSNALKTNILKVDKELIEKYGAVSQETAESMAKGIKEKTGTDISLSVTGIAGPGGGSESKPAGLVYIALAGLNGYLICKEFHFNGDRNLIRLRTANEAIDMIRRYVLSNIPVKKA